MRAQKNNHRSPKMPKAITMIIALIGAPGLLGLPTPNEKSSRLAATTDAERDEKPLAQKARAARPSRRPTSPRRAALLHLFTRPPRRARAASRLVARRRRRGTPTSAPPATTRRRAAA